MKWNEITWYSKLAWIIFIFAIFPIIIFSIGRKYEEVVLMNQNTVVTTASTQTVVKHTDTTDPCSELLQQQAMNQCARDEFEKTNDELNQVYAKVTENERFKSDIGPKIALAQRSWIEYRKLECEAEGSQYEGGSLKSLIVSDCMTMLTKERLGILKAWLESFAI